MTDWHSQILTTALAAKVMSTPATGEELLELVVKSGLLTHDQLEPYAQMEEGSGPDGARRLAEKLVADNLLTPFQTRQLLAGKTRGYFFAENKYKALAPLGVGALGPVILCEDLRLQQRVAVKLLQQAPDKDSGKLGALERFVRENLTVGTINHPNLVRVFGMEWAVKTPCIVMEYAEGTNLKQFVNEAGPPPISQAVQLIQQAAAGLQHAHTKRLLHRAVKPANLILGSDGVLRVTGFGLSHLFRPAGPAGNDPNDPLLVTMADFMSPEQAAGTPLDSRSDVYSLGATLYFLLTGRAPFESEQDLAKPNSHRFRLPPSIRELRPEVTYGLIEVIGRMMAKNPNERYSSANDASAALMQWSREPISKTSRLQKPLPVPPPPPRREPVIPPLSIPTTGSGVSWGAIPTPAANPRTATQAPPTQTQTQTVTEGSSHFDAVYEADLDTPRDAKAPAARSSARHVPLPSFPEDTDLDTDEPLPPPSPRTSRVAVPQAAPIAAPASAPMPAVPVAAPASAPAMGVSPLPAGIKPTKKKNPILLIGGILLGALILGGGIVTAIATNAFGPSQPDASKSNANRNYPPPNNQGTPGNQGNPGNSGTPSHPGKGTNDKGPPDKGPPDKGPGHVAPSTGVQITGSGSTFVKPAMEYWTRLYEKKTGVKIAYSGIGSGRGIENMIDKVLDFGCTDAFMTEAELKKAKNAYGDVLHIPLAMGAVVVTYNLEGVKEQLRLTGPILAQIYLGEITKWNDERIADSNPGVTLPDREITVVRRSDKSGTTAIWTEYLSTVSSTWKTKVGTGTTVKWPTVAHGVDAEKNEKAAKAVSETDGAIGYVELSFALEQGLKYAQVKNKVGTWVQPSLESVTASANAALLDIPPDLRYSLIDRPGEEAYPISGTTWLIVYVDQTAAKKKGKELVKFLYWVVDEGQSHLKELRYAPLPPKLAARVKEKIAAIQTGE